MINFVFLLLYIRSYRFTLYSLYSFRSLAILSALTAFSLLPFYALSLLALSTLSLSLLSLCLLSLFFCFFLYILSSLFSTLYPFSALSFSVSILYNWILSLLSTLFMLFLLSICLMFWYFTFSIRIIMLLDSDHPTMCFIHHLTESYIVKSSAFADHAPFLLWLYQTIHVEYRQLLLRHNRKGAWSANADNFAMYDSVKWHIS